MALPDDGFVPDPRKVFRMHRFGLASHASTYTEEQRRGLIAILQMTPEQRAELVETLRQQDA